MAKLKPAQIYQMVEHAAQAIQAKWPEIRAQAASEYAAHGRGAFILHLDVNGDQSRCAEFPIQYCGLFEALQTNDNEIAQIMRHRGVECYNSEREIAFIFLYQELDGKPWVHTEILSEYPDGTPRPTDRALKKRWTGFNRTCPQCGHTFIGLANSWPCPRCGLRFMASEAEYESLNRVEIEPIARFVKPVTSLTDFNELYDVIRELVIQDGEERLPENERLVWYAVEMYGEVCNGGFYQYFDHLSGDHAQELLRLFRAQGFDKAAELFGRACFKFPNSAPSLDVLKRHEQMDRFSDTAKIDLESITSECYALYPSFDDLYEALWEFWRTATAQPQPPILATIWTKIKFWRR